MRNWSVRRTNTYMIVFLVYIILILNGCGRHGSVVSSTYEEEYNVLEDYNPTTCRPMFQNDYVAVTEKGFYFISGQYLFYVDSETMQTQPLCFKDNCLHLDETDPEKTWKCSAFVERGLEGAFLAVYKDRLYYTEKEAGDSERRKLIESKLDGSDRKTICQLPEGIVTGSMCMHRGVFYFSVFSEDLDGNTHSSLNAVSLVSGRSMVEAYIPENQGVYILNLFPYGNYVYFEEVVPDVDGLVSSGQGCVRRYSIQDGSCVVTANEQSFSVQGVKDGKLVVKQIKNGEADFLFYDPAADSLNASAVFLNDYYHSLGQTSMEIYAMDDELVAISCFDKASSSFLDDMIVMNGSGETAARIPDFGWSYELSKIISLNGTSYLLCSNHDVVPFQYCLFKKEDLLTGQVTPIVLLEADSYQDLYPETLRKVDW